MTTIAYRNGVLAADTGTISGGCRVGNTGKIAARADGCLAAAAGLATYAHAFLHWFTAGSVGDPPKATQDQDTCDRGMIFRPDGTIQVFEPTGSFVVTAPYYATGSGRPEALGAMFNGADARGAIAAAIEHDIYTFGEIMSVSHDEARGLQGVKEAAE